MAIFPVILCGGEGTRLWPASRRPQPKPFIDLIGPRSMFEEAVHRVAELVDGDGALIVVAGQEHLAFVHEQMARTGRSAIILVEPEGRDSGPAMAVAAAWIARKDPGGVALFVASDHHIPDSPAFRAAAWAGLAAAASSDRIITFGVRPTGPSSAYGYIKPEGAGLAVVSEFVEKPDAAASERYIRAGYLWNSGNIAVRASVLLEELERLAPSVHAAAQAALPADGDGVIELTGAFRAAPRISMDHAVLEKSRRISVLPVDFSWSDLGDWDTIAATGAGDRGLWVGGSGEASLVRVAQGMVVATAGVSNLAIIAEPDAVLVCSLECAHEVKGLVERLREVSPGHANGSSPAAGRVDLTADRFVDWMRLGALPLWATLGVDADGGFRESLDFSGRPVADFRRARVQARQAYVYSAAGAMGWDGPWRMLVELSLARFDQTNLRDDGLYRTRVALDGAPLDETASLYDQAFALLAFAAASAAGVDPGRMSARARSLRLALVALAAPNGGWREDGGHPWQANAHMHLLEACLAWEALEPDGDWRAMADRIVALARRHFIDPQKGLLREFFKADWSPAEGEDGRLVEPGHQFEWAWLLTRWGRARGDVWAATAAKRLYEVGGCGVDARRSVACDSLNDDLSLRSDMARLWPQTERLKAALILAETATGAEQAALVRHAREALVGLGRYLEPSGLWRDKMLGDGRFVDEPAPASSFYHIMAACQQLTAATLPGPGEATHGDGA